MPLAASLLVIILIAIALAALAFVGLTYLVNRLGATAAGAATGASGPAPAPQPPPYQPQLDDLAAELRRVQDLDEVTEDDCATLRAKHQAAVGAGAPPAQTDPALAAIDALCPQ